MQSNPAYAVPSEARTTAANVYEYVDNIPTVTDTRRNNRRAVLKRSTVALIFSTIALVATLTCLILIIKQQVQKNNGGN